jgi:ankyrin repeat protein
MLASEQGFFECVKNLCEGGANVELAPSGKTALSMNLSGQTPLFCAAKEGHIEIVKYLLERGANPNATNHYGVSVLWIPCQRGLNEIVELLLANGANPEIAPSGIEAEERSISGWTPLYAAIKSRQYQVVKTLLIQGNANPNAVTSLGSTPFLLASEIGDLDVIKCFVEHGADLDYSPSGKEADELNITGQTALFMATLKEQNDVVQYLIEKGSKVNVKNRYGVSPLLLCAEGGNETLVKLLVQVGADVNMSPSGDLAVEHILAGQTPLYGAAKKGHYHICKFLIENGAQVNAQTMVSLCLTY